MNVSAFERYRVVLKRNPDDHAMRKLPDHHCENQAVIHLDLELAFGKRQFHTDRI